MLETFFEPGQVPDKLNLTHGQTDISISSTVVCTDHNLSCDLQGEAVLLNLQSGTYFALNPLGARIWELIQKPIKVTGLPTGVPALFGVSLCIGHEWQERLYFERGSASAG